MCVFFVVFSILTSFIVYSSYYKNNNHNGGDVDNEGHGWGWEFGIWNQGGDGRGVLSPRYVSFI